MLPSMPENVLDQDRLIREAGVVQHFWDRLGIQEDALCWAAVLAHDYGGSELLLCAAYREGEFPERPVRRSAVPLAHNVVEAWYDGISPPLTLEQLQWLEQLAIGTEPFVLEHGRRFACLGMVNANSGRRLFPGGTLLTIDSVTFGHVYFRDMGFVLRTEVTPLHFTEVPTWNPDASA